MHTELDPAALSPGERYKLLIGGIVPRPIAFVSTISRDGRTNLAPFSFFCGVGSNPMTLAFCPASDGAGGDKDTLRNCLPEDQGGTGVFVVNVASEAYERKVALAAEPLPPGESEFDLTGLTPLPGVRVTAPRVAESPLAFECRTLQVIRTNPGAPAAGNLVLGEVLYVHAHANVINERLHVDPDRLAAIARMGGLGYCRTRDRFDMMPGRT